MSSHAPSLSSTVLDDPISNKSGNTASTTIQMCSQQSSPPPPPPPPPLLKRSHSGDSQSSYASALTTISRASSKLLFGEIQATAVTTVDGRPMHVDSSICNLVLSSSPAFLRFWLDEQCRDHFLAGLEPEQLLSMRLVCHDFSSKAAPHLFDSVTLTFRSSSFTKPARIEALSRIGRYVKTLTFHMPHSPHTVLPPVIDPETGAEKQFIYEPRMQNLQTGLAKNKVPKYGSWEMQDLLIKQYPPLFHAATNVPAFIDAFSELVNLTHLQVSCPGSDSTLCHRRSVVDYALISLRIAVERAPLYSLSSLSLHPMHAGGLLYLHPMHGFGSSYSSAKRWGQIRRLSICMESIPLHAASARARAQSLEHLRTLHAYLRTLSHGLTSLFFRWKGERGPSPLSLDKEPCMLPMQEECMHPSLHGQVRGPRPLKFTRLQNMSLENGIMDSTQIADFIHKHRRTLAEFNFENIKLREGDWEQALAPLTQLTGSDRWKRMQQEVMDVPIMMSAADYEPRIMGPLLAQVSQAMEGFEQPPSRERTSHAISRWLSRPSRTLRKSQAHKEGLLAGGEHVRRFLRLPTWKASNVVTVR